MKLLILTLFSKNGQMSFEIEYVCVSKNYKLYCISNFLGKFSLFGLHILSLPQNENPGSVMNTTPVNRALPRVKETKGDTIWRKKC